MHTLLTSTNEAASTTVVVHQIVNKSLRTHLTVHRVFQCSTWAVNKGLVYVNSTFIDPPSCYIKTRNHGKVCSNYYIIITIMSLLIYSEGLKFDDDTGDINQDGDIIVTTEQGTGILL